MMHQFEVLRLRDGTRFLLMLDNEHYDPIWGFYKPVRRLGG